VKRLRALPLAACLLAGLAASVASGCAEPPPPVAPAKPAVPEPSVYLPRDRANGWPYCFDPDSAALRTSRSQSAKKASTSKVVEWSSSG
jgi:type IV pilus biogenesis protein CpaD/CtpE